MIPQGAAGWNTPPLSSCFVSRRSARPVPEPCVVPPGAPIDDTQFAIFPTRDSATLAKFGAEE